ncbi:phospholipase A2, minor isoenzyme-like isoform X2 [Acanthochromis polyacanthus]|uniref:phospholipase A2, minor isoenzyme-like isoform X2 n=1 Tax=Acanthochromis polyacanthus TaxID=80966 RepID=UPI002233EA42|nr:phospholipase A2, minor isoenzyme-like isoform X2 [Acanthochromis polyacanthus]
MAIADLPYVISYDYICSSNKVTCSATGHTTSAWTWFTPDDFCGPLPGSRLRWKTKFLSTLLRRLHCLDSSPSCERRRFLPTVNMNTTVPLLLLLLTACVVNGALLPKAVWQFGNMISCFQPGVNPLRYNEYGCWCGIGGSGTPVDDLDRCCKVHDNCYEESRKTPGCTDIADLPYVISYDYTCSSNKVTCSGANDKCQAAVCECDRVAAECFARTEYNPEYKNLDTKVHCSN